MKRTLARLMFSLILLAMTLGFASANAVVNVTFLGVDDMLSKAAIRADLYKDHAGIYYNAIVGMIPITFNGEEQQAYCFDINADAGSFTADQMLLNETTITILTEPDVARIAYIVDQYPLGTLGTPEAKVRGTAIQDAVWRLLYGASPLYTVYPTTSPVPLESARTGADLAVETSTAEMLLASVGKRLLEGDGTGSLNLNLTQDPNNPEHILVVLTATQGTSPTCGQPVSLFTDEGVFEVTHADFIDGVTNAQGKFETTLDISNVTAATALRATCHNKPKPPCPQPDPEPQTLSVTVGAQATGRSVILLLSQGNDYQDMIYTQTRDYSASATCTVTPGTIETPRTIGFWKHQVKCALQNKSAQVSKQTLRSFLPLTILGCVRVDSLQKMYDILWLKNATMRQRAQQQYLATLLNIAWGQIGWGDYVDTNYDKKPDMTLWQAIWTANLAFNWGHYEMAKNICDSINNSGEPSASATPLMATQTSKH
ncbi:MAG TPA: hypothetical protein PLA90_10675 [Candidatus Sumerlaeota bacterium]|nr:hypothetical protein [Candidatus Sumerlaeota bacterium]